MMPNISGSISGELIQNAITPGQRHAGAEQAGDHRHHAARTERRQRAEHRTHEDHARRAADEHARNQRVGLARLRVGGDRDRQRQPRRDAEQRFGGERRAKRPAGAG